MTDTVIEAADLFCGAGGTSTGLIQACGAMEAEVHLTAINHWKIAIATHSVNHPNVRHLCESLDNVDPRELYAGRKLDLLWASPECTHHSIARGGKPINDQSRATAWAVVRWAEALQPTAILIENVKEFQTWGPIGTNGRPLKSKAGEVFRSWVAALQALGYKVDWKVLRAADYGDPTTRERLFVQAVRGRKKIVWPEPTHAAGNGSSDMFGDRMPWVPAKDIIDWSLQGQSIFERDRPLADKTLERIRVGLKKYGFRPFLAAYYGSREGQEARTHDPLEPLPTVTAGGGRFGLCEPFIVPQMSGGRVRGVDEPIPTLTTTSRGVGLCQPFLVRQQGQGSVESVDDPVSTVVTKQKHGLVQPFLVKMYGTGKVSGIGDPVPTITANGQHLGLCQPFTMAIDHTGGNGSQVRPISDPLSTITTEARHALVEPFLIKYYGNEKGIDSVNDPLDTVTTKERFGLVRPIVEIDGGKYMLDIRFRMLQPHELAAAQGFPRDYQFEGTKTDKVRQIGNAVPVGLARALCKAVLEEIVAKRKAA